MTRLCVYLASNVGNSPVFVEAAAKMGTALASREIGLVYGGGNVGLMGVLADATLAAGGEVIGVMPEHLVSKEIAHDGITELRVTANMHERKEQMADLADGFIAMPGGYGTLEEITEMLTWNQLGLQAKPVVFLDLDRFWSPLLSMFDAAVECGFVRPSHRMLAQRAVTVDEAIALATAPVPETPHKWLDRDVR
jgi:uncharacterized protein (TIGR00730 family)